MALVIQNTQYLALNGEMGSMAMPTSSPEPFLDFDNLKFDFRVDEIDMTQFKYDITIPQASNQLLVMYQRQKTMDLKRKLSMFVKKVCAGRCPSHGWHHMKRVAARAVYIYRNTFPICLKNCEDDVATVAWLHDVADHKYDLNGELKKLLMSFLLTIYDEVTANLIMKTIEFISYSRENNAIKRNTPIDFVAELGEYFAEIRNIVSDADKLEALDITRCIEFTQSDYLEKNGKEIPYEELKSNVIRHAHEKLLLLKDNFIRTEIAKQIAIPLHKKMEDDLGTL